MRNADETRILAYVLKDRMLAYSAYTFSRLEIEKCGLKLADEERIRATLTGMNCIQYCEGGWTTPDPIYSVKIVQIKTLTLQDVDKVISQTFA